MEGLIVGAGWALWLGILTSISPCPMATNIAAMAFIGKRVDKPRLVFLAGALYTAGRMLTYVVLSAVIVAGLLSDSSVAQFLQTYMNKLLGPILILMGMLLLELIQVRLSGPGVSERMQKRFENSHVWGAALLGVLFAVSFCPVSAGLFFGMIPLSITYALPLTMPCLYGLGTGLPVMVFAALLAFGTHSLGTVFNKLTVFEWWARRVTGAVFILVGIHYSLTYIFGVLGQG